MYGKTNGEVYELCIERNNSHADQFPNNNQTIQANLYKGMSQSLLVISFRIYDWSIYDDLKT